MVVRGDQIDVFVRASQESAIDRLAVHLHQKWPQLVANLPEAALRERIARALQNCDQYGLQKQIDIQTFVEMSFYAGDNFHRDPRIAPILRDPSTPTERKHDVLIETTPITTWDELSRTQARGA